MQFFYKRWPIIFFCGRGCFFVRCCSQNLQCRSALFFRSSSTEFVFRPTSTCFHLLSKKKISQPRKKNMIHRYWSENMLVDVGQERWSIQVLKKTSLDDADRTVPNRHQPNIIQGLNIKHNSQHRQLKRPHCYFSADVAQAFIQTLADNFSLR